MLSSASAARAESDLWNRGWRNEEHAACAKDLFALWHDAVIAQLRSDQFSVPCEREPQRQVQGLSGYGDFTRKSQEKGDQRFRTRLIGQSTGPVTIATILLAHMSIGGHYEATVRHAEGTVNMAFASCSYFALG